MSNIDYKEVGRRIAKRRKDPGLKQYELCERLDVYYKYISNLETGCSAPSPELIMKLCDVLHTTPDYFLVGAESLLQLDKRILSKAESLSADNKGLLDGIINLMLSRQNK